LIQTKDIRKNLKR